MDGHIFWEDGAQHTTNKNITEEQHCHVVQHFYLNMLDFVSYTTTYSTCMTATIHNEIQHINTCHKILYFLVIFYL